MSGNELAVLTRAHQLFSPGAWAIPLDAGLDRRTGQLGRVNTAGGQEHYRTAVYAQQAALASSTHTDAALRGMLAAARADHTRAREQTGHVVAEARADAAVTVDTALAQREAMRRRAARLRAQQAHVQEARQRALQHAAAVRGLRYRRGRRHRGGSMPRLPRNRAGAAVRAALTRLGRPYVWGATGPDQFDCSGLTQWAYAQAGVHLDRTTYAQIHDGIPVPRGQIRPGDLVFPHAGHVQLALGNNLVIEAPHAGAAVRISRLGDHIAIRRPVP